MLTRCENPKNKRWERYGGRGITVCDEWHLFDNFLADMGERPDGMSIDREDNDGNYEPSNCRWATKRTQSENTSQVILVMANGEIMGFTAACKALGITADVVLRRMTDRSISRQEAIDLVASEPRRKRRNQ